jgi:hypothetical protein
VSISSRALPPLLLIAILSSFLAGCASSQSASGTEYQMGERVSVGPLTYNVVESVWRSQLGDALKVRIPDQRFLVLTISVTNGGGKQISVPFLTLQNQSGQMFQESENGEEVDNWFGLLRNLDPAQTQQGRILFDVVLSSYRLRVTDGGDPGTERFAWVEIPLRIDTDEGIDTPVPGLPSK